MKQLDEATRRALLDGQDPPRGAQERVLRAILAAGPAGGGEGSGSGELGGELGGSSGAASGRVLELGFAAKVVGATLGLTAAGLVSLALASAGVRSLRAEAPMPARTHEVVERAPPPALAPASPDAPPRVASEPASTSVEATSKSVEPASKSVESHAPREPNANATTTTLEAELALMQAARAAATPAAKLELLEQHAHEFAQGVLADEREVLRVETECALGRVAAAEARAAAFVLAKPNHPLRSRVEPACEN